MLIGYARVSANDQNLAAQIGELKAAGCQIVLEEKRSGTSRENREQLGTALKVLQPGGTLVVTRLDRLARSLEDLLAIARRIKEAGASLQVLKQNIDTGSATGELFFHLLGAFAQFETRLRSERQMEGIAKAKEEGRPLGRPQSKQADAVRAALKAGKRPAQIVKELTGQVGLSTIYRIKSELDAEIALATDRPPVEDSQDE